MSKLAGTAIALSLALVAPASAHALALGPEAEACTGGQPAVLVRVEGFKQRTGILRVQLYGDKAEDFLAKGKRLKRIDLPVTARGVMDVCVGLPSVGTYAVAVRHDLDGDGKSGWNDGGGFSRNPNISITNLKPKYRDVAITVGADVRTIDVVLNYRRGLSIGPVKSGG